MKLRRFTICSEFNSKSGVEITPILLIYHEEFTRALNLSYLF